MSFSSKPPIEFLEARRLLFAGDLDSTFGFGTGAITIGYSGAGQSIDYGKAVAVQSDGKIVAAGVTGISTNNNDQVALARFDSAGNLDSTFGSGGKVGWPILPPSDVDVQDVAIQTDGKIVVAGAYKANSSNTDDWMIARFTSTGAIDTTFGGGDGVWTQDGGANFSDWLYEVTIQSDGKILATGFATQANGKIGLIRLNSNGTPDTTFDSDGIVLTDIASSSDVGASVIVETGGKIVVAGYAFVSGHYQFALARYTSTGALDTTFDGDGRVTTDFGVNALAQEVIRRSDGKYIVGGLVGSANLQQAFTVARYNTNGSLDGTFGTNASLPGTTLSNYQFGAAISFGYGMALQPDGKILFGGTSIQAGTYYFFGLARFTDTGAPDLSFGSGGVGVQSYLIPGTTYGRSSGEDFAFTADGKIVMVGEVPTSSSLSDIAVIQVLSGLDLTAPSATLNQFVADRHAVRVEFSEDVSASVSAADLMISNVLTGQPYSALSLDLTTIPTQRTRAEWVLPINPAMPDGYYRATLRANSISDPVGHQLPADYQFLFFILGGDVNHDSKVDVNDLNVVAANWMRTGRTFSQGNVDYSADGLVNSNDLATLSLHWQQKVTLPLSEPTASIDVPRSPSPVRAARPVVSPHPLAAPPKDEEPSSATIASMVL